MEKIRLHIDPKGVMKKPIDGEWPEISSRIFRDTNIVSVSVRELAQKIDAGHTICPAVMGGSRAADWQEQRAFMVDIDNADDTQPYLALKQALAICTANNLTPAIYYQTFGYSKERPKYRLVFITEDVITNPAMRRMIAETLVSLFPESDRACINANRLFLGTNKKVVLHDENARISAERVLVS